MKVPFPSTARNAVLYGLNMILLTLMPTAPALAQTRSPESFLPANNYSEGVGGGQLAKQVPKGPAGWGGTWSLPKSGPSAAYVFRDAAALTYPAIAYPAGGGVEITPADDSLQVIGRKLEKGVGAKGRTALYMSFLMRLSAIKQQGSAWVLCGGIGGMGAGVSDGNLIVLSRQDAGNDEQGQSRKEWVPLLMQPYEADKTYYFIVKISDGEDAWSDIDSMEIWINPASVATEADASNAQIYNSDSPGNVMPPSGSISDVSLRVENMSGVTVRFDELRVGDSWESVTAPAAK